jgi:hypothetical protein
LGCVPDLHEAVEGIVRRAVGRAESRRDIIGIGCRREDIRVVVGAGAG